MLTRPLPTRPWSRVVCRTIAAVAAGASLLVAAFSCNQTAPHASPKAGGPSNPAAEPAPGPLAPTTQGPATAPATQLADVECRWTEQPIVIDGKADEEAWAHAQVVDD